MQAFTASLPARGRRRSLTEIEEAPRRASLSLEVDPEAFSGQQEKFQSISEHAHPILEQDALRKVVEHNAIRLMTGPGDEIRTRVMHAEKASKGETESVFHTPKPLGIIVGRWYFQLGLLVWCVVWAIQVAELVRSRDEVSRQFMHYRFVPTQLRDKSEIEGRLGITNFHLLLDGCRIAEAEEVWEEDGMLFKSFIKTTAMNGWSIITQELQPGADAVAFRIEGSNDMLAWDLVGAPVWRAQSRFPAMQFKYRTEPLRYSTARSAEITFDPRRTPERSLSLYTAIILSSVAAVAIVLTWLDRVRLASWVLVGCLPVISVLGFMTGVELIAERRTFQAFRPMADSVLPLLMAAGLTVGFVGPRLAELMALGALPMLISVVDGALIWRDSSFTDMVTETPFYAFFMALLFLALMLLKRRRLRVSRKAMEGARAEYEAAWNARLKEIDARPDEKEALQKLSRLLEQLSNHSNHHHPKHAIRIRGAGEGAQPELGPGTPGRLRREATNLKQQLTRTMSKKVVSLGRGSAVGPGADTDTTRRSNDEWVARGEEVHRVRDMDQVYTMARLIQPFLRAMVFRWAASSGGCLRVKPERLQPRMPSDANSTSDVLELPPECLSRERTLSSPESMAAHQAPLASITRNNSSMLRELGSSIKRALTSKTDFLMHLARPPSSARHAPTKGPSEAYLSSTGGSLLVESPLASSERRPVQRKQQSYRIGRLIQSLQSENLWGVLNKPRRSSTQVDGSAFDLGTDAEWQQVDPGGYDRVAWTPLKGVKRFINKCRKVYGGNVSKVIDVCRERIVFDTLADLYDCVDTITKDSKNVQVRRIKNGLTTRYADFEGFRLVVMDLWLIGPQVAAIGLDHYVVELQLLLRPFVLIQERTPHKQYIEYRNARTAAQLRTLEKIRTWLFRSVPAFVHHMRYGYNSYDSQAWSAGLLSQRFLPSTSPKASGSGGDLEDSSNPGKAKGLRSNRGYNSTRNRPTSGTGERRNSGDLHSSPGASRTNSGDTGLRIASTDTARTTGSRRRFSQPWSAVSHTSSAGSTLLCPPTAGDADDGSRRFIPTTPVDDADTGLRVPSLASGGVSRTASDGAVTEAEQEDEVQDRLGAGSFARTPGCPEASRATDGSAPLNTGVDTLSVRPRPPVLSIGARSPGIQTHQQHPPESLVPAQATPIILSEPQPPTFLLDPQSGRPPRVPRRARPVSALKALPAVGGGRQLLPLPSKIRQLHPLPPALLAHPFVPLPGHVREQAEEGDEQTGSTTVTVREEAAGLQAASALLFGAQAVGAVREFLALEAEEASGSGLHTRAYGGKVPAGPGPEEEQDAADLVRGLLRDALPNTLDPLLQPNLDPLQPAPTLPPNIELLDDTPSADVLNPDATRAPRLQVDVDVDSSLGLGGAARVASSGSSTLIKRGGPSPTQSRPRLFSLGSSSKTQLAAQPADFIRPASNLPGRRWSLNSEENRRRHSLASRRSSLASQGGRTPRITANNNAGADLASVRPTSTPKPSGRRSSISELFAAPAMTQSLKHVMNVTGKGDSKLCSAHRAVKAVEWMTPVEMALKDLVFQAVQSEGGPLMRRMEGTAHDAFAGSRIESVSFSSSPLPSMAGYRRVQFALAGIGLLFCASAISFNPNGTTQLAALRFTLHAAIAGIDAPTPTVLLGGTLRNGCPAQSFVPVGVDSDWVPENRSVGANGWYFVLDRSAAANVSLSDAVVGVEGLRADEADWDCLLADAAHGSECVEGVDLFGADTDRFLRDVVVHGDPDVAILHADLRAPLAHVLGFLVVPALRGVAYFVVALVGYLDKSATHMSNSIVGSLHLAVTVLFLTVGVMELNLVSHVHWWFVKAASMLALCIGVMLEWRGFVALQGVVCLLSAISDVQLYSVRHWISHRTWWVLSGDSVLLGLVLAGDVAMMCAALYLTLRWRYTVHTSARMILKDKMTYDTVWKQFDDNPAEKQYLADLQTTVSNLHTSTTDNPRQRIDGHGHRDSAYAEQHRVSIEEPDLPVRERRSSLDHTTRHYVRSLDQLYAQAKVVDILLRDKVKRWAEASNGFLRGVDDKFSRKGSRWIRARDCATRPELRQHIVWGGTKKVDRSIQKILRSYNGDVSRLVDISRACIAFESVKDLNECVVVIAKDAEEKLVHVVRLKNRLSPQHDSTTTAGYRDVAMNLVLCSEDAVRYRVSSHVAELQLILLPFAKVKTNEGHQRYVQFRNLRAE